MLTTWLSSSALPRGVVVAAGNPLVSLSLGLLLAGHRIAVAGATGEAEARDLLAASQPGLLICVNDLDQGSVASLIPAARRQVEGLRVVLMLSVVPIQLHDLDVQTVDVVVCRDDLVAEQAPLQQAVLALAKGKRYMSPSAQTLLSQECGRPEEGRAVELTPREEDVLRGILQGQSDRQIALALSVTQATVRDHGQNIRRKYGVASRSELLGLALRRSMGRRHWLRF